MTLRVKETFFIGSTQVTAGQLVNDNDPIVKGKEHLFESTEGAIPMVEMATAAPGQRRNVRRPARRARAVAAVRRPGARPAKAAAPEAEATPEADAKPEE